MFVRQSDIIPLALGGGLFVAYVRTLAPGVTWANHGSDSGDLITAAATLGVAHPTGYPTYLLLARLFQLLPFGDLAVRTTLLSAAAAALAAVLVFATVRRLAGDAGWHTIVAAALAGMACGLAPVLWSQAVVAEEYALNALAAAILVFFVAHTAAAPEEMGGWRGRLMGLAAGLALGNHVTIAVLVAAWLATTAFRAPPAARWRMLANQLGGLMLGLLVYLYLPLRAAANPPVNWGDPRDLAGFWWVISGGPYRGLAFGLPEAYLPQRLAAWAGLLIEQYGLIGVGLAVAGLLYRPLGSGWFLAASGAAALVFSAFAIGYDTVNSYAYLLPAYVIFAVWLGLGVVALLNGMAAFPYRRSIVRPFMICVLLLAVLWPVPATMARVDASGDFRAIDYAQAVLRAAPPNAMIIATDDQNSFPLWYYHHALGERPDIAIIVAPLLEFPWYRASLRATYPDLLIPEAPVADWAAEVMRPGDPLHCRVDVQASPPVWCAP